MLTVSGSLGRHAAGTLPCSTSPPGDQHAAPALTWAAAAMIALTVRRQRPQSAPAPHASATCLEVHAPPATTSATTCLVAPVHRHTNISALPLLRQRDQRQRDTGSGADHPRRDWSGHVSGPFMYIFTDIEPDIRIHRDCTVPRDSLQVPVRTRRRGLLASAACLPARIARSTE